MYAAFPHTDTDAKAANTEVESANAAFILRCYRCLQTGHIGKDCPMARRSIASSRNVSAPTTTSTPQGGTSSGNIVSANAASSAGTGTPRTPQDLSGVFVITH